ncbi:DUF305 domain-containing protein [Crystallibacter degradans]|uniref:DUF305 domain-containing protein n=1 Tax=Crystallibacter degradans TaxID=2726743 RepID=UPI0014745652|nr:DUF305 domain-containing protein [Arthrobacter sp. SF27]NMR31205.1 DUF305 domain-containing protein [Arthrobacter sp. SF27]
MKDTSVSKQYLSLPALAVAAAVALSGCGGGGGGTSPETTAPAAPTTAATSASAAEHNSMDTMFAQMMIPHHQQANEMSEIILAKDGIDPKITDMANEMIAKQTSEIQTMQGWLTAWNEPSTMSGSASPGMSGPDMEGMTGSPSPGMSGMPEMKMMTPEEMEKLESAQGAEAEELFLTQMSAHHESAIQMAEHQVENGSNPEAVALAEQIIEDQEAEIQEMKDMLAAQ